jgi:hypothetical protein
MPGAGGYSRLMRGTAAALGAGREAGGTSLRARAGALLCGAACTPPRQAGLSGHI